MPDRTDVDYIYDGSFSGLMTAVFRAYENKHNPVQISTPEGYQLSLGRGAVSVETDGGKAARVKSAVRRKMGERAMHNIETLFLCCHEGREVIIYRYIRYGMRVGYAIHDHLTHDDVKAVEKLCGVYGKETHMLIEFIRFTQLESGVYYSKITPVHIQVPRLMPHFTARFNTQPFMIHDAVHNMVGVYDLSESRIMRIEGIELPPLAPGEKQYQRMWVNFYKTISIKEREKPALRRQHMPKKYWRNMTEFTFREDGEQEEGKTTALQLMEPQ